MSDPIARLTTFRVRLPYRAEVRLRSVRDTGCPYLILVIETTNGLIGISEVYARPEMSDGTDLAILDHQIQTFFKPVLLGLEIDDIPRLMQKSRVRQARSARALIDVAYWDLKAKALGVPAWRLFGGGPIVPIPVTKVVFGNTSGEMVKDAVAAVERGYRSLKIKVWKRAIEDIDMVHEIRRNVGEDVVIYVDANTTYSEAEARRLFPLLEASNVELLEDPCRFTSIARMADMARDLPIPMMADSYADSLASVYELISHRAAGAISIKLRRPGLTEALKIIAVCEAANIPAVVGTDLESRVGVLARAHLRAAHPYLEPWPSELQFFEHLQDDCFVGRLAVEDGMLCVPDGPGFGVELDMKKIEKYRET